MLSSNVDQVATLLFLNVVLVVASILVVVEVRAFHNRKWKFSLGRMAIWTGVVCLLIWAVQSPVQYRHRVRRAKKHAPVARRFVESLGGQFDEMEYGILWDVEFPSIRIGDRASQELTDILQFAPNLTITFDDTTMSKASSDRLQSIDNCWIYGTPHIVRDTEMAESDQ